MATQHNLYRNLLRLYPRAYREAYGEQMIQTLNDMLDDQPSAAGRAGVRLRVALDLPASLINQQMLAIGSTYMQTTPGYIKRNSLVAAALLVPFVGALSANATDKLIYGHTLYRSWVWSTPVLTAWVAVLPALAFGLAFASCLLHVASTPQRQLPARLLDLAHTWPVLVTGLFSLAIIGLLLLHDSTHCWAQSPVYVAARFHQTWQCTAHGFLGGQR